MNRLARINDGSARFQLALMAAGMLFFGLGCAPKGDTPATNQPGGQGQTIVAKGPLAEFVLPPDKRKDFETALVTEVRNAAGDEAAQPIFTSTRDERDFALATPDGQEAGGRAVFSEFGGYSIVELDLDPATLESGAGYAVWLYKSWSGREKVSLGAPSQDAEGRWKLRFVALSRQLQYYDSIVIVKDGSPPIHVIEGKLSRRD